ncbi:hypothetical protein, partial [Amycolatopsis sp. NPDC000740]
EPRVRQALALLGHRWHGSENPVIRVSTDGVVADLPENAQKALNRLLDYGQGSVSDIIAAITPADSSGPKNKNTVRGNAEHARDLLVKYKLVYVDDRGLSAKPRYRYQAAVPPKGGLVVVDPTPPKEVVRKLLSDNRNQAYTAPQIKDATSLTANEVRGVLLALSTTHGKTASGVATYQFAPEPEGTAGAAAPAVQGTKGERAVKLLGEPGLRGRWWTAREIAERIGIRPGDVVPVLKHRVDVNKDTNAAGVALFMVGEPVAKPVPVALGVVPDGFDAIQARAWDVLAGAAGVWSAGALAGSVAAGGGVLGTGQGRRVVAEFARRVAALTGDAVQREVLAAAAARYEELGGSDPAAGAGWHAGFGAGAESGGGRDLAGEPVFRRWMAGRLRRGGAVGARVGQALALMGYSWAGSENPVIRVSTDGVVANLPEGEQKVLDHLLEHGGPATHGGIVAAVKGAVRWTGPLTRLAMYGLVRRSEPSLGRFVYEAVPPPVDGLVHAEGASARERILALFSDNPRREFTRDEVRDALPGIIAATLGRALTAFVDGGVLKLDGARYRLAPEEDRPGAGEEGAGRGKRQQQSEGDAPKRRRLTAPASPAAGRG